MEGPTPGRAIFGRHVYSVEDYEVAVCTFDGARVAVMRPGVVVHSIAFRRHVGAGGIVSKYAILSSREEIQAWNVSALPHVFKVEDGTIPAEYRWRWLPHGAMDHATGIYFAVEHLGTAEMRRRLWAISYQQPQHPRRLGMAELGAHDGRGGVVEPFAIGKERYVAVTISPEHTAIVRTTAAPGLDVVSVDKLPCFQAMSVRNGILYGHDGVNVRAWWSSWGQIHTQAPELIDTDELESGVWYDQDPNCETYVRGGRLVVLSGAVHGDDFEALHILEGDPATGKVSHRAMLPVTTETGNPVEPALIDIDQTPERVLARVSGFTAFAIDDPWESAPLQARRVGRRALLSVAGVTASWRYWLLTYDLTDLGAIPPPVVVELHP